MITYKPNLPHNPRNPTWIKVSLTFLVHQTAKANKLTSVHGVNSDLQLARPSQQTFDGVKVKDGPKEVEIDIHWVHYLH